MLKVYKGFNKDWTCRGYQFKVGETFVHEGDAKVCNAGFHACEYPLDIFNYYPPTGQIAECELDGVDPKTDGDTKRAGNNINIKLSLTIPMLIAAAIEYTTSRCNPADGQHATGYKSASSATGNYSASSATGNYSASSATGNYSASSATGDNSASSATGYKSASSATGDNSASSATGNYSASSATGYKSASSATGEQAIAAAFGLESKAKADEAGIIVIAWWDESVDPPRKRLTTGYVGEGNIEPNVWYSCDSEGKLVEVKE